MPGIIFASAGLTQPTSGPVLLEDFSGTSIRNAIGDPTDPIWEVYTGVTATQSLALDTTNHWATLTFTGPVTTTPSSGPYFVFRAKPLNTYGWPNGYMQTYVLSGTFNPNCNRLTWWVRCRQTAMIRRTDGGGNFDIGTYIRAHGDTDNDDQGQHYYHGGNVNWWGGRWRHIIMNRRPAHRVGLADDLVIPDDPEAQGPFGLVSAGTSLGWNVNLVNGSTTVTVPSGSYSIGAGYYLYFATSVSGTIQITTSQFYLVPTSASGSSGGTFQIATPYSGATVNNIPAYYVDVLPSSYGTSFQSQPHYFDGITRVYCDLAPGGNGSFGTALDNTVWDFTDFYFDNATNEPDSLVACMMCVHTTGDSTGHYELSWYGIPEAATVYDIYYGTSPLKNADGTYNGAGTHGGTATAPGGTYVYCYWDSPTMAEAPMMYFLIVPQGQSSPVLGSQFAMPQKD